MAARDRILARIAQTAFAAPVPPQAFTPSPVENLTEQFESRFQFHQGEIWDLPKLQNWTEGPLFVDCQPNSWLETCAIERTTDVWSAACSVTNCHLLIAETGTIVMQADPGSHRLASLCPEVHIVLARKSQIVAGLDEAIAQMGTCQVAWITGPSRTADIEGILVNGIHGPKRVGLVWTDDWPESR